MKPSQCTIMSACTWCLATAAATAEGFMLTAALRQSPTNISRETKVVRCPNLSAVLLSLSQSHRRCYFAPKASP